MNVEETRFSKIIAIITKIPHYYFTFFDHVLDAVQYVVTSIPRFLMIFFHSIIRFFRSSNENRVGHIIFIPFIYIFKFSRVLLRFLYKYSYIYLLVYYIKKGTNKMTMAQKKALTGYGFLSPWFIGFFALVLYPIGLLTFKSFNDVRQSGESYNYTWVGLDNYHRILRVDIDFMMDVQDFIVRVFLYTPVIIALAVIIAMLLNQDIKGKGFFRMVFFLPIIILNGELLSTMSENGGMDIHLSPFVIDMLRTIVPLFAYELFIDLFSIIIEILWYTGVPILIFLAMLQKIDKSLYEAASIDGASSWSIFWKITLPIIRPAISVAVIFIVVFLANFDGNVINSEIIRSNGDPSRYQGYAAAMAIIYSIIQILVISILLLLTRQRNKKGRA